MSSLGSAKSSGSVSESSSSSYVSSSLGGSSDSTDTDIPSGSAGSDDSGSTDTDIPSGSAGSSSSDCCHVEIELVEMEGYDAAVQLSNLGACDLNVVASTDNPSASVSPSGTFIAAGGSQLFLVTLTDGPGIDGTTVYFETDHCGTYAVHIDSTSVPPGEPEDTTGVPPGEFE